MGQKWKKYFFYFGTPNLMSWCYYGRNFKIFPCSGEISWERWKWLVQGQKCYFWLFKPLFGSWTPQIHHGNICDCCVDIYYEFWGVGGKKVPFWPKNGISGSIGSPNIHFWQFKPNFASWHTQLHPGIVKDIYYEFWGGRGWKSTILAKKWHFWVCRRSKYPFLAI